MTLKRSFKFSYSFLTSCEHVPQPRWLLPHLQSNIIRQNKATECFRCAHLGLQRPADCASTPQKKLTKDWILWLVFQTGQSELFSHRVVLSNSAPFLQLTLGITFILCATASWKFTSGASFHHLKSLKTSPGRRRVYTLNWSIKAQVWSPQTQVVVGTRSPTH